ncbi:hypothetical protein [Bifidobacterium sp. SO1]|uniref:hypothetical protein n=1 Tax=Bifidobacterium sp. SO1 TaxID=2809029 RepID=UPI001BDC82A2|nr:hypothetical protein [Bifidobacterium sp. SO1]MBT1162900.1 hypothetical protein [Bifidobacterium sp. SO1]
MTTINADNLAAYNVNDLFYIITRDKNITLAEDIAVALYKRGVNPSEIAVNVAWALRKIHGHDPLNQINDSIHRVMLDYLLAGQKCPILMTMVDLTLWAK